MIDLYRLQLLCDAATAGEWHRFYGGEPLCIGGKAGQVADVTFVKSMGRDFDQAQHDAAFIATARQALPELIAEVRELRRHNANLLSAVDRLMRGAEGKDDA